VWSEEDESFVATSLEFPYLSGFGQTPEEATAQLWKVIQTAIEVLKEDGDEIPQPQTAKNYSGQTRVRMPISLHERLAKTAEKEGVSLNTHIVTLLQGEQTKEELAQKFIDGLMVVAGETSNIAKSVVELNQVQNQYFKYAGEPNQTGLTTDSVGSGTMVNIVAVH